ncbi:MAG: hypothetical protein WC280_01450 [Patescibacteria group bacterium]
MNLMKSIKNIYKKDKFLIPVIFVSIIFFFISSILPNYQRNQDFLKFFSPDENANFVFTKLYSSGSDLFIFEKYNLIAEDIVTPRSYVSNNGYIKPVSFLGMTIYYGFLAKIFGSGIIPFLTPFFASLALVFYYLLIRKLFDNKNAFLSFFILFSFPVLVYYSARSMFHNVLFLSLFVIGLYFLVSLFEKKPFSEEQGVKRLFSFDFLYSSLSGLFFGMAIAVRSSEIIWMFLSAFVLFVLKIKKVSILRLVVFLAFVLLPLIPIFYNNQMLYGSPFFGGYNEMNRSIESISYASGEVVKSVFSLSLSNIKELTKVIFNTIFYFGFYPNQSIDMFGKYFVKMFWYLFWPGVFGFLAFFIFSGKKKFKKISPYIISWMVASIFLVLYYGSWKFVDNPDPNRFTIGNSYTRYWLPIYIGAIPFVSFLIIKLSKIFDFIKRKSLRKCFSSLFIVVLISSIMFISFKYVYSGSEEGLKHYFSKLDKAKFETEEIIKLTESNAVIITEYHDKFIFPERKVVVGRFNDDNMNRNYFNLTKYIPVYYYNFTFPEKDMDYLNSRRLKDFNLQIELISNINETFSLYRIFPLEEITIDYDL